MNWDTFTAKTVVITGHAGHPQDKSCSNKLDPTVRPYYYCLCLHTYYYLLIILSSPLSYLYTIVMFIFKWCYIAHNSSFSNLSFNKYPFLLLKFHKVKVS